MVDTLETARSFGLATSPTVATGEATKSAETLKLTTRRLDFHDFDDLERAWVPLTIALNSFNRSMDLPDLYPFVPPDLALKKVRFVHDVVTQAARDTAS
jgi:hypothetical protein